MDMTTEGMQAATRAHGPMHRVHALFPLLEPAELAEVLALAEETSHAEGDVLLSEGQDSDCLFLLLDGVALVTKSLGEVEIVVAELSDGELVGEMSFAGQCAATATVTCASRVNAIRFGKHRLLALFEARPALGMRAYRSMALMLSRRLMRMNERFVFASA